MIAGMELIDAALVVGAGLVAGIVNAMAGGGSLLTVALLNVFVGLPGLVANGTNRVGVLVQLVAHCLCGLGLYGRKFLHVPACLALRCLVLLVLSTAEDEEMR